MSSCVLRYRSFHSFELQSLFSGGEGKDDGAKSFLTSHLKNFGAPFSARGVLKCIAIPYAVRLNDRVERKRLVASKSLTSPGQVMLSCNIGSLR